MFNAPGGGLPTVGGIASLLSLAPKLSWSLRLVGCMPISYGTPGSQ